MPMITDPIFYLVAVPAMLIMGMSKGGFGGSAGALAVPMMALVADPLTAAAIALPVLLLMDAVAVWKFRRSWSRQHLAIMLPAALPGIAAAALLMGQLPVDAMRVLLGGLALFFCLHHWFWNSWSGGRGGKPGRRAGYFWGMVAGFTSTQIHAGEVPASIYLLPQRLDKMRLMGTNALFFATVNLLKLLPYSLLGQFDRTNLGTSLLLLPLAPLPLGVLLGHRLLRLCSESLIYRILYGFLAVAGGKLIWDGLSG